MDYQLLLEKYLSSSDLPAGSAQRRLHACLRRAIQQGILLAGTRLPSSRDLAQELRISRNTVVYAYEQLITEGFLISDRRGSVVSDIFSDMAATQQVVPTPSQPCVALAQRAQGVMPLPVAAELNCGFAPGVPSLADFPVQLWRTMLDRTWRSLDSAQLGYSDAAGELRLRAAIAAYLRALRGVECEAEQVIITDGTQSSLDLCAHAFADPQDKVWIENPGYIGAQIAFRAAQLDIIAIKVDEQGLAPTASDWQRHAPKLIYVTPSHQFPTGGVLGLERRMELIRQAMLTGALIIEDDYDSEFRHDGPPLAAMQGLVADAPVLYLGTFSKTLFPALRIAYMVVPKNLIHPLRALVAKASLRGRSADQLCLARFIQEGHFALHLRRMRRLYCQRRDCLVQALRIELDRQFADADQLFSIVGQSAGMHLALRFHTKLLDDVEISARALAQGIVVPALSVHKVGKRSHSWQGLMLGYAQVTIEDIPVLVHRLVKILLDQTAHQRA